MKPAAKDVGQALSLACRRLEFGLSDVARFGLSDVAARLPAGRVGLRADVGADGESALACTQMPDQPYQQAAVKSPKKLLQPVLPSGNKKTKTARKTCAGDVFLPTAHPTASKKVIENKDTIG